MTKAKSKELAAKKPASKKQASKRQRQASSRLLYAHDWGTLGDGPRISRWPSLEDAREIDVRITSYIGIAPGAKHYEVTVAIEDQQWWSDPENCWVRLSCDTHSKDYALRATVLTRQAGESLANEFVKLIKKDKSQLWRDVWDGRDVD